MALLLLGACTGTGSGSGVVYNTNFTAGYSPRSLAAAQPLFVETFGSPAPDLTQESITQATVQGLRARGPSWMGRNYTGNPEDAPKPAYVVRFAYGAPKAFSRQELCKSEMSDETMEAARGRDEENATRTVSAVCSGKRAVALAEGSPGGLPDIQGERFEKFVGLLGRRLMPRRNPVFKGDCIFRRCD